MNDIKVDSKQVPTAISVRIKQSKTDPFRQGVSIYFGRTDTLICPVAALLSYLVVRGSGEGPLFMLQGGQHLSRSLLVCHMRKALSAAGLNPENYAGHSFRIGAATTAAACGVPVEVIKTLGQWRSEAYQLYVRLPNSQLSSISRSLARARV